eukprot:TRINITY_DN4763_c0_g1_i5.p1 TRINITY_DN4763_c0_g1~~TRINITY_DN4763_c0_g1_i5.p1  ORF type:complete len:446 (+),score=86.62 TRINITY_DN4763_c0_g1_i5:121-1338(+)
MSNSEKNKHPNQTSFQTQPATFNFGVSKRKLLKIKRAREEPIAEEIILECKGPQQKKQRNLIIGFQQLGFQEFEPTRLRFRRVREVSVRSNLKQNYVITSEKQKQNQLELQQTFREKWKKSSFRLVRGLGEEDEILKQHKDFAERYDVITVEEIVENEEKEQEDINSPESRRKEVELQMMKYLPLVQQYLLEQGITYKPVPISTSDSQVNTNAENDVKLVPKKTNNICNDCNTREIESKEVRDTPKKEQEMQKEVMNSEADDCEYEFYEPMFDEEYMSDKEDDNDYKGQLNQDSVRYQPIIIVDDDLEEFWPEYLAESESEEYTEDSNAEDHWANDYPEEEDWDDEDGWNELVDDDEEADEQEEDQKDYWCQNKFDDPYENHEYDIFYDSEEEREMESRRRKMYF